MNINNFPSDQTDDPILFKSLTQKPKIAWPTIMLLVVAFAIFGISTFAYVAGTISLFSAILLNSIAAYISFTPVHDASHNAVSTNRQLNEWVGRIGSMLLSPTPFFRTFRYMHMQHHRFTNDKTKDPDFYAGNGPSWLLPFKWATLELNYFRLYLQPNIFFKRPESERMELYLGVLGGVVLIAVVILAGWLEYYLLLFFIPSRIANYFIAVTFDFLPHYPHQAQATDEPFRCTSNRVGMEWLLTPILLSQNYHLVHHLYPTVPFYRYLKVWNAKKRYHESQNPAVTDVFTLVPRNTDEDALSRSR
ncbi:MAG: fatty acid desaturase [bacterium]